MAASLLLLLHVPPPAAAPAAPPLVVHILIDTLIVFAARDFVLCAVHAFGCQGGSWDERDSSVGLLEVSGRGVKQLLKWHMVRRLTNSRAQQFVA